MGREGEGLGGVGVRGAGARREAGGGGVRGAGREAGGGGVRGAGREGEAGRELGGVGGSWAGWASRFTQEAPDEQKRQWD